MHTIKDNDPFTDDHVKKQDAWPDWKAADDKGN